MKKQFIIGEKPKRKQVLKRVLCITVVFVLLWLIFMKIFTGSHYSPMHWSALISIRIIILVGYFLTVFFSVIGLSLREYFILDEHEIRYYANEGFVSQIRRTLDIIEGKDSRPLITIKVSQIADMTLLYSDVTSFFYFKGHMLIYRFDLKDGTYVIIKPDSFHFRDLNIAEGIEFMKDTGVKVHDPYHLLKGLQDPNIRFVEYVERIVKKNENHL